MVRQENYSIKRKNLFLRQQKRSVPCRKMKPPTSVGVLTSVDIRVTSNKIKSKGVVTCYLRSWLGVSGTLSRYCMTSVSRTVYHTRLVEEGRGRDSRYVVRTTLHCGVHNRVTDYPVGELCS